jgi:hypothetical protein
LPEGVSGDLWYAGGVAEVLGARGDSLSAIWDATIECLGRCGGSWLCCAWLGSAGPVSSHSVRRWGRRSDRCVKGGGTENFYQSPLWAIESLDAVRAVGDNVRKVADKVGVMDPRFVRCRLSNGVCRLSRMHAMIVATMRYIAGTHLDTGVRTNPGTCCVFADSQQAFSAETC